MYRNQQIYCQISACIIDEIKAEHNLRNISYNILYDVIWIGTFPIYVGRLWPRRSDAGWRGRSKSLPYMLLQVDLAGTVQELKDLVNLCCSRLFWLAGCRSGRTWLTYAVPGWPGRPGAGVEGPGPCGRRFQPVSGRPLPLPQIRPLFGQAYR